MRSGARRAALVAALAAGSVVAMGCSGDDGPQADDASQSVDEVADSWGEIKPPDEERTRSYLGGAGSSLLEYADFATGLDERLDDAAYSDRCADLRAELADVFPSRRMLDWLYALPDPILGRLWTSQLPAAELALTACAGGNQAESAEAAEQVSRIQELVDRRLHELGVER